MLVRIAVELGVLSIGLLLCSTLVLIWKTTIDWGFWLVRSVSPYDDLVL